MTDNQKKLYNNWINQDFNKNNKKFILKNQIITQISKKHKYYSL